MKNVVVLGVTYYVVDLGGGISIQSFDPQELIIRMAQTNLSLN